MRLFLSLIAVTILITGCGVAEHLTNQCSGDLDGLCDTVLGEDRREIPAAVNGTDGQDGSAGADGEPAELYEVVIQASRTYSPSTFSPGLSEAPAGVYSLPEVITLTSGVAGTGWVSIILDGIRYCYQGNGRNNNDPGSAFQYRGAATDVNDECFEAGRTELPLERFVRSDDQIELQLNGGGVSSSIRTDSSVEAEILALIAE